jgi:hypothetical protein
MARTIKSQDTEPEDTGPVAPYVPKPNTEWRQLSFEDYTDSIGAEGQAKIEHLRDVTYDMVLNGANLNDVMAYFGLPGHATEAVKLLLDPVVKMAKARLAVEVKARNLAASASAKANPILRIWVAKQHAEQRDEAPQANLSNEDDGTVNLNIRVVRKGDPTDPDAS